MPNKGTTNEISDMKLMQFLETLTLRSAMSGHKNNPTIQCFVICAPIVNKNHKITGMSQRVPDQRGTPAFCLFLFNFLQSVSFSSTDRMPCISLLGISNVCDVYLCNTWLGALICWDNCSKVPPTEDLSHRSALPCMSKLEVSACQLPSEGCKGSYLPCVTPTWQFPDDHQHCGATKASTQYLTFISTRHSLCVQACLQISPFVSEWIRIHPRDCVLSRSPL